MQKEEGCVRNKVYQASLGALEKAMVSPDSDIIEAPIIGIPPVGHLGSWNGHRRSSLGSDGDNQVLHAQLQSTEETLVQPFPKAQPPTPRRYQPCYAK